MVFFNMEIKSCQSSNYNDNFNRSPYFIIYNYKMSLESQEFLQEQLWKDKQDIIKKYCQKKQFQKAEQVLTTSLSLFQTATYQSNIHYELGRIKYFQNKLREALNCYNQALRLNPQHEKVANDRRLTKALLEGDGKQIDFLEEYLLSSDDLQVLKKLAQLLNKEGYRQKSIYYYKRIIQKDPGDAQSCSKLAKIYLLEHHYQLAAERFQQSLALNSCIVMDRFFLAYCYLLIGKFNKSQQIFFRQIKIESSYESRIDLGNLILKKGRYKQALQFYKRLQQKSPEFKIMIYIPKEVRRLVNRLDDILLSQEIIKKNQFQQNKKQYEYCKNMLKLTDKFPALFSLVDDQKQINLYQQRMNLFIGIENKQVIRDTIDKRLKDKYYYIKTLIVTEAQLLNIKKMSYQQSDGFSVLSQQSNQFSEKYHSIKIDKQNIGFYRKGLIYSNIQRRLIKAIYLNVAYLSMKKTKFIIKCFVPLNWKDEYFKTGFYVKTKRGDNIGNNDEDIIYGIWKKGRDYVYSWITSIAGAIGQLEAMGFFHCHIQFRHTILFEQTFKLTNFNYLFKVRMIETSQIEKQIYNNMKESFYDFLQTATYEEKYYLFEFLFRNLEDFDQKTSSMFDFNSNYQQLLKEIIKKSNQTKSLMTELRNYSQTLHFLQFERLVKMLLTAAKFKQFAKVLSIKEIEKINRCMKWLQQKQIGYKQFVYQINNVKTPKFEKQSQMASYLIGDSSKSLGYNINIIHYQKLKYYPKGQKYIDFKKIVMKNVYLNVAYLSSKNNENNFIVQCFVAKHWKEEFLKRGFHIKTKIGNEIDKSEKGFIFGVWKKGRKYIYSWITSIACAISEMEMMGFIHCDIEMNNTVLFEDKGTFVLIDFDYLFKVKKVGTSRVEELAFESTLALIKEYFNLGKLKDMNIIRFLFKRLEEFNEQPFEFFNYEDYIDEMLERVKESKNKTESMLKEMEDYGQILHYLQFQRLVKKMLNAKMLIQDYANQIESQQVKDIFECLKKLCHGQITYWQFTKEVKDIDVKYDITCL